MQDAPAEMFETGKIRHVRRREMAAGVDHVIERFRGLCIAAMVLGDHGEATILFVKRDVAHHIVEADVIANPGLFDAALDVVPQHFPRRIRGDRAWPL